ncbi:c-type cytochrome [Caenispirillum bisanense]|uniref:Cytochrome c n=1 Tax=Caenispirillum bisanense TaxID=414052 RepID=A0A286GM47_9PROT|nr:c-type cytochrome [Caenispirillum bisanense]SOD96064.1 Cytochrome c [Caenispirillum bisanense]
MTTVRRTLRAVGAAAAASFVLAAPAGAATATDSDHDALLARGAYLMNSIVACGNCHTPMGPTGPLAGMELAGSGDMPDVGMVWRAANLTPDPDTGLGAWTDAQLATAIRDGVRPDGSLIGPPMPVAFYKKMADADVAALIAYLRSISPVKHAVARSSYDFPLPASWGPPASAGLTAPDRTDPVAYGGYLADIGHCMHCHTPLHAEAPIPDERRVGAGGLAFPGPWGVVVAANITADRDTGIGGWTDQQVKDAITKGVRPDGSRLVGPMPVANYANMTPEDLDALVAWLRTVPAVSQRVR